MPGSGPSSLRREIRELHRRLGFTILYVTHDQREAFEMSTQVVVLNEGRIAQQGTPEEVRSNPAPGFVAESYLCDNVRPEHAILVVEDQKKMSGFLKKGLVEAGHAVDVAETGASGETLAGESLRPHHPGRHAAGSERLGHRPAPASRRL